FNDFLAAQLTVPGQARLTLVQFDDSYEVPVAGRYLPDVPQLTAATYTPRGSTALLDAIGRTIQETDRRVEAMADADKPAKVIVAVFTDGFENASTHFTSTAISDLIRRYRDEKGWEFLFLAANQDAIATASQMRMDVSLSASVDYSFCGIKSTGSAMARKVRASRLKASGQMDAQALADDAKPLDQILREEEGKQP
ncbi:MAG: vWA domain-containing protein, partial [Prosthecobacter sp.]